MTEAELQEQVRLMCGQLGLFHYHPHDSRRSEPGWPDSVIIRPGRLMFRGLKSASGRLTSEQTAFRYLIDAHPAPWRVDWQLWRPADLVSRRIQRDLVAAAGRWSEHATAIGGPA